MPDRGDFRSTNEMSDRPPADRRGTEAPWKFYLAAFYFGWGLSALATRYFKKAEPESGCIAAAPPQPPAQIPSDSSSESEEDSDEALWRPGYIAAAPQISCEVNEAQHEEQLEEEHERRTQVRPPAQEHEEQEEVNEATAAKETSSSSAWDSSSDSSSECVDGEESNETQWRPASATTSATTAAPSVDSVRPTEHETSAQPSSAPGTGICGICLTQIVDSRLNCGHTLCGSCFLSLTKQFEEINSYVDGSIVCPFCRKRIRGASDKIYII
eukprot:Selendium_serpulae@DN6282_c0_g1_i3.p1